MKRKKSLNPTNVEGGNSMNQKNPPINFPQNFPNDSIQTTGALLVSYQFNLLSPVDYFKGHLFIDPSLAFFPHKSFSRRYPVKNLLLEEIFKVVRL